MYKSRQVGVYVKDGKHFTYPLGGEELPIIGWHYDTALLWLKEHMYNHIRIVNRDGVPYIVTRDVIYDRVNITIVEDIITEYTYG
jgi:hypothetical protein